MWQISCKIWSKLHCDVLNFNVNFNLSMKFNKDPINPLKFVNGFNLVPRHSKKSEVSKMSKYYFAPSILVNFMIYYF